MFRYSLLDSVKDGCLINPTVVDARTEVTAPTAGRPGLCGGVYQSKRSEVLFVDYIAEHLAPNGRAAVIVPEGIVFP